MSSAVSVPNRWRQWLYLGMLAACCLYLFPYFPSINNPNENVRLYMTRSIVDEGMVALGRREKGDRGFEDIGPAIEEWGWVNDKALVCDDKGHSPPNCTGELHSAKAPGTSYLGVPVYAALKGIGGEPVEKTNAIFWLRLCCVMLPTVAFLWFFWFFCAPWAPAPAARAFATTALGIGSLSFTYGHMFAGHQLASISLFAAFASLVVAARRTQRQRGLAFAAAGFWASAGVLMEYPTAMPAAALAAWALWLRPRFRDIGAAALGAAVPGSLLALFHTVAFGAPWRTPYSTLENPQFVADIAPGVLGVRGPTLEAFAGSFFAPFNGLFFFAPWTLLAVILAALALRRSRRGAHADAAPPLPSQPLAPHSALWAAAGVVLLYGLFISSHSLWRGGWTLGPRYIVGIAPFMAFIFAAAGQKLLARAPWWAGTLLTGAVAASVAITLTCTLVSQGFPFSFYNPWVEVALPLLQDGWVAQNLGHKVGLLGLASAIPLLAIAVGLCLAGAAWIVELTIAQRTSAAAAGLALAALMAVALSLPSTPWTAQKAKDLLWLQSVWRPNVPNAQIANQKTLLAKEARGEQLTAPELMELGWMLASQGKAEQAATRYARARTAAPLLSTSPLSQE